MVKNSIVSAVSALAAEDKRGPSRLRSGPDLETEDVQDAEGRFIWQLVGVLET
jgi:hypothetical protein